jgi:hypothetical protein
MTDAEFELELVEALNMLLEDERASVEMEVALASGATEYGEREALAAMGTQDIRFCEQLREEMERAGLVVTQQINGVVFQVIGAERYDDRLRAFAHHQHIVAERARELQESNLEGALRDALEGISLAHDRDTQWSEQRANEFAATRSLEFGGSLRSGIVIPDDGPVMAPPTSADHTAPASLPTDLPTEPPEAEDQPLDQPPEQPSDEGNVGNEGNEPDAPETQSAPSKPRARTSTRATSAAKAAKKPATTRSKAAPRAKPATTRVRRTPSAEQE